MSCALVPQSKGQGELLLAQGSPTDIHLSNPRCRSINRQSAMLPIILVNQCGSFPREGLPASSDTALHATTAAHA